MPIEEESPVVGFPRFRKEVDIDTGLFHPLLLDAYRTMVGPGHWFEMDDRYMRIGFGHPTEAAMAKGLAHLDEAAGRARREQGRALRVAGGS